MSQRGSLHMAMPLWSEVQGKATCCAAAQGKLGGPDGEGSPACKATKYSWQLPDRGGSIVLDLPAPQSTTWWAPRSSTFRPNRILQGRIRLDRSSSADHRTRQQWGRAHLCNCSSPLHGRMGHDQNSLTYVWKSQYNKEMLAMRGMDNGKCPCFIHQASYTTGLPISQFLQATLTLAICQHRGGQY